jgi:hypothetical protein
MADPREPILARLAVVCAAVTDVAAVARNKRDVPGLARPAVIILDGAEARREMEEKRVRWSQVQFMDMSPTIRIIIRGDDGAEAGALLSLFRGRLAKAILSDATLRGLVGTNGDIQYDDFGLEEIDPEGREFRATFTITFSYPFRLSDFS